MKPSFRRMTPHASNMVAETKEDFSIELLCVECGWNETFGDGSKDHFFNHKCRLVTEMVSTLD